MISTHRVMLTLVKGDSMRITKSFGVIAVAIVLSTGITH